MSHTRWVYLIPLDKKITIVCDLSPTHRPTSFLSASASLPRHPSKTSERNGSLKFTTTAPVCLAS